MRLQLQRVVPPVPGVVEELALVHRGLAAEGLRKLRVHQIPLAEGVDRGVKEARLGVRTQRPPYSMV